jgi:integrase
MIYSLKQNQIIVHYKTIMEVKMSQYKRQLTKGVRWYFKFDYDGETYHSKAEFLTKQEAAKAERTKREEVEYLKDKPNQDMTLLELINERLDYLQVAKTQKYYKDSKFYFKKLFLHFNDIPLKEIEKKELINFLVNESKTLKNVGKDNYAVNAMIRSYKALFSFGIKFYNVPIQNPCQGIDMFPIKKKIKYIPTDKEIDDVIKTCSKEQRLLVEFVRDTGCRISEALNLSHKDVFDGYVVLYTRKSKSGNLRPRQAKFNTSKFDSRIKTERIFECWTSEPRFLIRKTQGKWNWHNLRHRFASKLSQSNTPIFEIMSLLGHSNIETTQNYLHLLPKS